LLDIYIQDYLLHRIKLLSIYSSFFFYIFLKNEQALRAAIKKNKKINSDIETEL